jgi:N-acetylglucosamine-6-phosphate deacetylase
MSRTRRVEGCVLASDGWIRGAVQFGDRVERFFGERADAPAPFDDVVLPGFVDLHVHGGGGADVMEAGDAIERIARMHARHGTTAFLATTVTAETQAIAGALACIGRAARQRLAGGARVLGAHLEGPYINEGKLGAQPACARLANLEEVLAWQALAPIRVITLAPELAGHLDFIRQLRRFGIVAQCGHTLGTYEEGVAALMAGVSGFTHLFNAMTPLQHREPGMVGAALAHAKYAELIPDLLHVHPGAIRAALRAIPHLYCVTDSTSATGMPDGQYQLGSHTVHKCMGGVRLGDGTLAGSALTMDQALRNLVDIGVELDDASRRLSTYPADYIGEFDRGRLAEGTCADIAVLTHDLKLKAVYVEGERVDLMDA